MISVRERLALEPAERMPYAGKRVTERFFRRLKRYFSDEEIVELAAIVAVENSRSRFIPVCGVEPQGFCPLPAVEGAADRATESFRK